MENLTEPLRAEKRRLEERLAAVNQLLGETPKTMVKEPSKGNRYKVDFSKVELPATFTSTQYRDALGYKISPPTLANHLTKFEVTKVIKKIKAAKGRSPAVYVKLKPLLGHSPVNTAAKVHRKGHR